MSDKKNSRSSRVDKTKLPMIYQSQELLLVGPCSKLAAGVLGDDLRTPLHRSIG